MPDVNDGSGEQTGAAALDIAGKGLGMIPFIGPLLSAGASLGSGLLQQDAAKKQAAQAAKIRQDALNTQKQAIRPEYLAALHMARMKALGGLPGMEQYKGDLAQQLADQIRYIRMASPSGNATLSAMGQAVANQNRGLNMLQGKDEQFRSDALDNVQNTLWGVGSAQRALEDKRDLQRTQGLTAAAQMESDALKNKQGAFNTAAFGLSGGANQIFDNMMKMGKSTNPYSGVTDWGTSTNPNTSFDNYLSNSSPGDKIGSFDFFHNAMSGASNFANQSNDNSYLPPTLTGGDNNAFTSPTMEGF